ncbi:MAG: glycosyltransferase family 4 protein [Acidobacteria bacterium]|nr:glycosyltransferase family 4 protein [Acidobacteriota bacterium]MBI3422441.1 glycosyltransferase family 4 protein [Acidobacteriota bacterium]
MNVLTFTTLWPNSEKPNLGVFVKHRALALARQPGVDNLRVVAPVPYFPKQLAFDFVPAQWRQMAAIAEQETIAGLATFHPRFFNPPKVGMRWYGRWMAHGAEAVVRELYAEQHFDLIDAHYVYPDGDAAVRLGAALGVPVCVTARGTDINLFARLPHIRPLIQRTLERAHGIIAVSMALKERMVELGIEADKIAVIRNGIDPHVFHWREQAAARQQLDLNTADKILVTVSALVPLKGIDRLIGAMQLVVQTEPPARLYIIGEGPERAALTAQIAALGLQQHVFLKGAQPQGELPAWYAAADVFCLASEREGCPNVVIEALACGAPVVASDVGGIGELVLDERFGLLVPEAEAHAAGLAQRLSAALARTWQREVLAAHGGARGWAEVAEEVLAYWAARGINGAAHPLIR